MQIAIISPTSPPLNSSHGILGGAETYVFNLAKGLAANNQQVTLITVSEESLENKITKNFKIKYLKKTKLLSSSVYDSNSAEILQELRCNKYDLVHVNQLNAGLSVLSCTIAKLEKTPTFLTDHGGGSPFLSMVPHFSAKFPDHFMAVSQYSLDFLRGLAPTKQSFVIYGGIDSENFQPNIDFSDIRVSLGLAGFHVILYVGKVTPHKGIEVLIKAFEYLPKNTKLLVVGPSRVPSYLAFLKSLANRICPGRLIITGGVPDKLLPKFYNACDVFVLPSVYVDYLGHKYHFPELLGLVKFEAMACGKPVVVSNVGGLPEQVINGKNGFVFDAGNYKQLAFIINALLNNDEIRRAMGHAGSNLVKEKFTWNNVAKNTVHSYESVLRN
jgi:glycosyltransferase involved in cell wall biosynthesis